MQGAGSNFLITAAGHAKASQNLYEIMGVMAMNFLMYSTDHELNLRKLLMTMLLFLSKTIC